MPKPRSLEVGVVQRLQIPRSYSQGERVQLSYELITELCAWIKNCLYLEVAARAVGVTHKQVLGWVAEGRDLVLRIENGQFSPSSCTVRQAMLVDLYIELSETLAQAEAEDTVRMENLAKLGDFNAIKFRLERRFPGRWGQRKTLAIETANNDIEDLATEERARTKADPGLRIIDYKQEIKDSEEFKLLEEQYQRDLAAAETVEIIEEAEDGQQPDH